MPQGLVAMLWDADGVLQHLTRGLGGWAEQLEAVGGPGFAEAVFEAEVPAMTGERPMRECLGDVLGRFPDARVTVDGLLRVWESFEVDRDAVAVVEQTRRAGVRCYLATNQQDHRTEHMRTVHGYDAWFDGVFYSSEVGAAKPDPAFFRHALATIATDLARRQIDPGTVGFVDDTRTNVEAARSVGITAVRHDPAAGAGVLRDEVAALGVPLPRLT